MVRLTFIVAVLGSVGTFLGIGTSLYLHQRTKQVLRDRKRVTWEGLRDEAEILWQKIRDDFDPDIIITPGLRGATVANFMQGVHENRLLYICVREDLRGDEPLQYRPQGYDELPSTSKYRHYIPTAVAEHTDQNVLLLDVFTDTGQTLQTFEEYLIDNGFDSENVRRATVFCNPNAIEDGTNPDYHVEEISRPFYFPWGKAV